MAKMEGPTAEDANFYRRLVESFLLLGPRFGEVGRQVGATAVVAQSAWFRGFPEFGYPPICNSFRELVRRRKQLVEQNGRTTVMEQVASDLEAPTPVEAVNQSASEATFTEVDMLGEFRRNVTAALGVSNVVLSNLDKLAQAVATRIQTEVENSPFISVEGLISSIEKLTKATTNMAQTTKTVFELQRLLQGAPTNITEHRTTGSTGNQGVSPELQEKLVQAGNVIDMMRRHRGLLPVEEQAKVVDADADSAYEGEEEHGGLAAPEASPGAPEAALEAEAAPEADASLKAS